MRTVALYLSLLLGIVGVVCGAFLFNTALRYRARRTRGSLAFIGGLGAFFVLVGSLALAAFAIPSARHWAGWSIAALLIARGVLSLVVRRVIKRRNRTNQM